MCRSKGIPWFVNIEWIEVLGKFAPLESSLSLFGKCSFLYRFLRRIIKTNENRGTKGMGVQTIPELHVLVLA